MLLDYSDRDQRVLQIAEYSMITALPMIVAPILGGLLADHVTWILSGLPLVFAASFIMRLVCSFLVLRLREPRKIKPYPPMYVFRRLIGLRPIEGFTHVVHVIRKRIHI